MDAILKKLPAIDMSNIPMGEYPDGVVADEIERAIAATLPVIPGLENPYLPADQRMSAMDAAKATSRKAFIEKYGDPFGCEADGGKELEGLQVYKDQVTNIDTDTSQSKIVFSKTHHAYFCRLCWKFTEEQTAGLVVTRNSANHDKCFPEVKRPHATEITHAAANKLLKKIIDESKAPEGPPIERLLYSYAAGYDYQLLQEKGLESSEVQDNLLDRIEQCLIDREWDAQVYQWDKVAEAMDDPNWPHKFTRQLTIKSFKPRLHDFKLAPESPSKTFCSDHNPNRSAKARCLYQNNRKRISEFEKEISRLYSQCSEKEMIRLDSEDPLFRIDMLNARQTLRKTAYDNVFSSTLDKIKKYKAEGKKLKEIADILNILPQAVSNALWREKNKV